MMRSQSLRRPKAPTVKSKPHVNTLQRRSLVDPIANASVDAPSRLGILRLVVKGRVDTGECIPCSVKIVRHQIKFRKVLGNFGNVDITYIARSAREGRREAVESASLLSQVIQLPSNILQEQIEVLFVVFISVVCCVSWIFPIEINAIKIIINNQILAIPRKDVPTCFIIRHGREGVTQSPTTNTRINITSRSMYQPNQSTRIIVIRTTFEFWFDP
mmetsp:Transcript_20766/g.37284  ORF Transcript_20766/g.37284 Transcript_20766/m.37284 type:complete len:216 (+) Transcript_20766:914-1561(+)